MLDGILEYLRTQIVTSLDSNSNAISFANELIKKVQEGKSIIREMFVQADFNITDMYLKKNQENDSENDLFFTHQTPFYSGDMNNTEESDGTLRMYSLSAVLFLLIKHNIVFLGDDFENSLHYDLLTHIIKTFMANSERATNSSSLHTV